MPCPTFICHASLSPLPPPPSRPSTCAPSLPPTIFANALRPLPLPRPLLHLLPPFDFRDIQISKPPTSHIPPALPHPYNLLGPLSTALQTLAHHHFLQNPHTQQLEGRVTLFRGTPCPKWHVDRVKMRGMVTLAGPGCVVLENENGLEDVVKECAAGDVVLMKGVGAGGKGEGVWHRSPEWEGVRVVVQTDELGR